MRVLIVLTSHVPLIRSRFWEGALGVVSAGVWLTCVAAGRDPTSRCMTNAHGDSTCTGPGGRLGFERIMTSMFLTRRVCGRQH